LPKKFGILVGQPLIVQPIIPKDGGGYATKSDPEVVVREIFKPFLEARENIGKDKEGMEQWITDRVW
jgi:hypothetical protein